MLRLPHTERPRRSGCHTPNGRGAPGLFPSLDGTLVVQQSDATTLIRVVLRRAERGHAARADRTGNACLWLDLERDQVADVLTYIRNSRGDSARTIDAGAVKK